MNFHFGGRTQLAGSARTGIQWPLAEWLVTQGGLVFALDRDYQELANELQQLRTTADVIDLGSFLREPAGNLSLHVEEESSVVISAGRRVQLFESWSLGSDRLRTVFMTREPDVGTPAELIERALAALANLGACHITERRSPVEPATSTGMPSLKIAVPGRHMIQRPVERFLARDPFQPSSSVAALAAFLIWPVR